MAYLKRYIESSIEKALETSGAVVVAGPKFCGKTTTAKLFSRSNYALDSKKKILLAEADPDAILEGETPRLIDEWQNVADLWNVARSEIDRRDDKFGQFIFTGSSTPAEMDDIYHSGAGRIVTIDMSTLSLFESNESTGDVSLLSLFNGDDFKAKFNENASLADIAFFICRGGWPLSVLAGKDKALQVTKNYCDTLFNFENSKNNKFRNKKSQIFKMILKSYARNISTEARKSVMIADVSSHEDRNLDNETFDSYLEALNDLFIIKDIDAWNPNFRSKTAIISTPTRHFIDPSIAAHSLNLSPSDLLSDLETFGLFFEDFAVKELRVYAETLGGEIRHYRDNSGLECDIVMHLSDSQYGLIEVKLGGESLIKEGISKLKSLQRKLENSKHKKPTFMMILTAVSDAYKVDDIYVVPITMLKA